MIIKIDKSFQKDISKINESKIKLSIAEAIKDVQQAENLSSIKNLKKLTGYKIYYRIRLGDYRIGLRHTEENQLIFVRFLHRKEIYQKWP